MTNIVEMHEITKTFPTVVANDHVDFDLITGEIHGLLGENGAGKTTLVNILYGLHQPDAGFIRIRGKRVRISSPKDAIGLGMGMVRQHFTLIPRLTVAENITIGFKVFAGTSGKRRLEEVSKKVADAYNLAVPLNTMVENLSVGERQRAEVVRALCRGAEIMILDEPTAVLTPLEVEGLFGALRMLGHDNKSTILITHKVREALTICDRITVMRRGKVTKTVAAKNISEDELSNLMVGSSDRRPILSQACSSAKADEIAMSMRNISALADDGSRALNELSLTLHPGEILGVAGVSGNGQKELLEVAAGLRKPVCGELSIFGETPKQWSRDHFIRLGVGYIPEDRMDAVLAGLPIWRSAVLGLHFVPPYETRGLLNVSAIKQITQQMITNYGITANSPDANVEQLSGGNMQRLVVARELFRCPRIVLAAQPTRGLDIAATEFVHRVLLEKKADGSAILLVSENLDEIFNMSDRIAVIYRGRIVGIFVAASATMKKVGALMLGTSDETSALDEREKPKPGGASAS